MYAKDSLRLFGILQNFYIAGDAYVCVVLIIGELSKIIWESLIFIVFELSFIDSFQSI